MPFESPSTVPGGHIQVGLRTIYSSSIASAQAPDLQLDYHLETAQPTLVLRLGLTDGLELHLEVPAVSEGHTVFDPAILTVESWFNTMNVGRIGLPSGPRFKLARPGLPETSFDGSTAAIGDVWLGVKGELRKPDGWRPSLAWRAALKIPTGRFPFGSGVLEGAVGLLAGADLGHTHLWLAADLMVPDGPVSSARLETRPHASLQLALGRELGSRVALFVQGSAHGSALRNTHVDAIDGWTFYLLAGARVAPTRSFTVGFSLAENLIRTDRGTDIAGVFELTWRH